MRLSIELQEEILTLAARGMSQRAIAERYNVSHVTIGNLLRRNRKPAPSPHDEPRISAERVANVVDRARAHASADAPVDLPALAAGTPAIDVVRELLTQAREAIVKANAIGDAALAQRQTRNAAALASVLARLERVEVEESDVLRISRAEIDEAMGQLYERVHAITDRPLMCAKCSAELSIEWGSRGTPE